MKKLWFIALLLVVSSGVITTQPSHASTQQHVVRDGGNPVCPNAKVCKP